MEILGYLAALLIGLSLGLTGSGGSILTVPILVYLIGLSPVLATSYSLFVVGVSSLMGGVRFQRRRLVCWKTVFTFGLPSLLTVYITRLFLIPALPAQIVTWQSVSVSKEMLLMVLFAGLMVWAALRMLGGHDQLEPQVHAAPAHKPGMVQLQAVFVGFISGLVGAGGGFLIIPALVLLLQLNMKQAVGTSLVLIALNSLVGFLGDLSHYAIDWAFLLTFTGLSVLGILIGTAFAHRLDNRQLKKGFGIFVLVMGIFILLKEIFWHRP